MNVSLATEPIQRPPLHVMTISTDLAIDACGDINDKAKNLTRSIGFLVHPFEYFNSSNHMQ